MTKNLSATFDDLLELDASQGFGSCATCKSMGECIYQFDSSLTNITVSRMEDDGCPPVQFTNFIEDKVSFADNGTKIFCAYKTFNSVIPYSSFYLNVSSRLPSKQPRQVNLLVAVLVPSLFILVVVIITVIIIIYKVLRRRKQKQCRENHSKLIYTNNSKSPFISKFCVLYTRHITFTINTTISHMQMCRV